MLVPKKIPFLKRKSSTSITKKRISCPYCCADAFECRGLQDGWEKPNLNHWIECVNEFQPWHDELKIKITQLKKEVKELTTQMREEGRKLGPGTPSQTYLRIIGTLGRKIEHKKNEIERIQRDPERIHPQLKFFE